MSCGHCGTSKNGALPTGCKDHGSCKSGGCNRLNVHDWLSLLPVSDFSKPFPFIEVCKYRSKTHTHTYTE